MTIAMFGGRSSAVHSVASDLYQMALDLCGMKAGTYVGTGESPLSALEQGAWFNAALSGKSQLPYIGELVQAGKLPRFVRTFTAVADLMRRALGARKMLVPSLSRIETALNWLPPVGNATAAVLQQQVRSWLPCSRNLAMPDIRQRFRFVPLTPEGQFVRQTASGRLGVPGLVKFHEDGKTHQPINDRFHGDDAGHLIGARFGAPDSLENLVAMNRNMNRGLFNHGQEKHWAYLLQNGYGIDATVTAVFRPREDRPFKWRVFWHEISPTGERSYHEPNLLYGNFAARPTDSDNSSQDRR
jgi:hypothetical protein